MLPMKFKEFISMLKRDPVLGYVYVATLVVIFAFSMVQALLGPANAWPEPWQVPDVHGVTFLLLVSLSIFLLMVACMGWMHRGREWIQRGRGTRKMLVLHLVSLGASLLLPVFLFIGAYFVAYLAWHGINAIFLVMLARGLSSKVGLKLGAKHKGRGMASYLFFWLVLFMMIGAAYTFIDWQALDVTRQMPLLSIPLFGIVVPVVGLVLKPRSGTRGPLALFSMVIFAMVMYTWLRYMTWDPAAGGRAFSVPDAILDLVLVTYTFFVIAKNSEKISHATRGRVMPRQLLLFILWCRVSSMILLLAVADYQVLGLNATEGSFLLGMFLAFVFGTIHAISWARKGLDEEDVDATLPDLASQVNR